MQYLIELPTFMKAAAAAPDCVLLVVFMAVAVEGNTELRVDTVSLLTCSLSAK